jgi:hypothetical protein
MAKWLCPCGNQIRSSGAIPNPQEWHLLSDADLSELFEDRVQDVSPEDVERRSRYAYRCDQCGRLHVFWDGLGEWPPTIYSPEST